MNPRPPDASPGRSIMGRGGKEDTMTKRMKLFIVVALVSSVMLAGSWSASHAFGFAGAGGKLGYSSPEEFDGTAEVAAHAEFAEENAPLHLQPNVMYWNVDHMRDLSPNLDVTYQFDRGSGVTPYLGTGMGLHFMNDSRTDRGSTNVGMNVIGGLKFPATSNQFFVEGRYTASDVTQIALMGGVTFPGR